MKNFIQSTSFFAVTFLGTAGLFTVAACSPAPEDIVASDISVQVAFGDRAAQMAFISARTDGLAEMIIAGGCFWCVESDFEKMPGVIEAVSGYTGGRLDDPTYELVGRSGTGHYEAVRVVYDPAQTTYKTLVDAYWKTVDPTDAKGQFCDKGESYRTAVFATKDQWETAQQSLADIQASKPFSADIVTPILPAVRFYDAESYHQDYYKKHSLKYKYYRNGCGRDKRLKQLWG